MSNLVVTHFNSGVVTPQVDARSDIEKYPGACRICNNMIPDLYGNATRRPGTQLIVAGNGSGCYFERPPSDPAKIIISTMEDLAKIGNDGGFPMDGDYELGADLDATGIQFWPIGRPSANPGAEVSFTGTFDGRDYKISNITYNKAFPFNDFDLDVFPPAEWFRFGLFQSLFSSAEVSNLIIENMNMVCAWEGVPHAQNLTTAGLLAGACAGTIANVHTQGTITITASGAGIATGMSEYGGMCGTGASTAIFTNCSANIDFNFGTEALPHNGALAEVGGFCGTGGGGSFTDCYAIGSITHTGEGTMNEIGGFCGDASNVGGALDWTNCYSAVTMIGTPNALRPSVGGLIGFFNDFFGETFTFGDCFWDGDLVSGVENITVYDIGHVGTVVETGYIGTDVDDITEGTSGDGGAIDMFKRATFTNWDFDTIWTITEDADYPTFQWLNIAQNCKPL